MKRTRIVRFMKSLDWTRYFIFLFIPAFVHAASFQGIGQLPGGSASAVEDVSPNGIAVTGQSKAAPNNRYEPFQWTQAEGLVRLSENGVLINNYAYGISFAGNVIVGGGSSSEMGVPMGMFPFRWTEEEGMQYMGQLIEGERAGYANDVSCNGRKAVGCTFDFDFYYGFLWTKENGMQVIDSAVYCEAFAISGDGSVVVGGRDQEAFRWTESGGRMDLGFLPGYTESAALDVSFDGSVVVGACADGSGLRAFRWTQETGMVDLGGTYSVARGVSADGSVIVGSYSTTYKTFIWDTDHGLRDLKEVLLSEGAEVSGWSLVTAEAVSADGTVIVGKGYGPGGEYEGWIAVLDGEPNSVTLTVSIVPDLEEVNSVQPSPGIYTYNKNQVACLSAEDYLGCPVVYEFDHWEGDVTGSYDQYCLLMDSDKHVTAVFTETTPVCGDACHPVLQGDLNKDCRINLEDFQLYAAQWLSCTAPECD